VIASTNVHPDSPRTSAAVAWTTPEDRRSPTDGGRGDEERRPTMASTPMVRADAYGLLPSILILLMLILASLGIVAHAATL
jgi:hypothetical protein